MKNATNVAFNSKIVIVSVILLVAICVFEFMFKPIGSTDGLRTFQLSLLSISWLGMIPLLGVVVGVARLMGSKHANMIGGICIIITAVSAIILMNMIDYQGVEGLLTWAMLPFNIIYILVGCWLIMRKRS